MATFTLKNIPADLYESLKLQAAVNRRSINSEIIACIESAVKSRAVDHEELLVRARRLRERSGDYRIGDVEFSRLKRTGRP